MISAQRNNVRIKEKSVWVQGSCQGPQQSPWQRDQTQPQPWPQAWRPTWTWVCCLSGQHHSCRATPCICLTEWGAWNHWFWHYAPWLQSHACALCFKMAPAWGTQCQKWWFWAPCVLLDEYTTWFRNPSIAPTNVVTKSLEARKIKALGIAAFGVVWLKWLCCNVGWSTKALKITAFVIARLEWLGHNVGQSNAFLH